jgi:FkbM family methyltransferase
MKNPLYQFSLIRNYAHSIGWPAAIRLRFYDLLARVPARKYSLVQLKLKNARFPIQMRLGSSDREVLGQVFIHKEYQSIILSHPRVILDLGANVGYSSAYFLSKYPTAVVLAVEPDPNNFAICCRNLEPFGGRARVVLGAAWPECAKLVLERGTWRDGREWTTQVRPAMDAETAVTGVEGYDLPTLIGLTGFPEIDLLKIDIERSELELFSRNTSAWLPRIRNVCIELHGSDCEEVFFKALSGHSYDMSSSEELTLCSNLRIRS